MQAVNGYGELFDLLSKKINESYGALQNTSSKGVIVVHDDKDIERDIIWQKKSHADGKWIYRVFIDGGAVFLGPIIFPNESGCYECLQIRIDSASKKIRGIDQTDQKHNRLRNNQSIITPLLVDTLLHIILHDLDNNNSGRSVCHTDSVLSVKKYKVIDGQTLACYNHSFLASPDCTACAHPFYDYRRESYVKLLPRRQISLEVPREPRELSLEKLEEIYYDPLSGVISLKQRWFSEIELGFTTVEIPTNSHREIGVGRTDSFELNDKVAILEALERAGGRPSKKTKENHAYKDIVEMAINPSDFILHHPKQYLEPNMELVPYNEDLTIPWVWAYSFKKDDTVLIPEQIAYYRLSKQERFLYEISNGCALGSSLEEAILNGLFEIIERDTFLATWYGQLSTSQIDIQSLTDKESLGLINKIRSRGYQVYIFYITREVRVPSIWVLAVGEKKGLPKTHSAAAASLTAEVAIRNALFELLTMLPSAETDSINRHEEALEMLKNPLLVKQMDDHSLLYSLEESFYKFDFLFTDKNTLSIKDINRKSLDFQPENLTYNLQKIIDEIINLGHDVIIVQQTTPEQKILRFHTVKVLVPSLLPMTFGHQYRRIGNVERFKRLKEEYGGVIPDFNTVYPHPFP
ncbi:TOMM precursor leader peptide-binding protein [Lysinibacillus agricola]|uniref:TOMM leader peptide-binding protein n=1 Tax=Lysinibacillus agricola TaxID=2590012 RepID=A0ABX7AWQ5_9BACI|nr:MULTISPECIES: TOMM precursor leader peptide-binding protein [Lysinibacillus]KOS64277.1 hypothetical protein AN161_03620 [Lysinibacillus sp. FJAT-14222]QQP14397.1 TOMM precursor leader peptide-binding protein [Lysinibacillus agricola]